MDDRRAVLSGLVAALLVAGSGLVHLASRGTLGVAQGADAPAYVRAAGTLVATGTFVLPPPDLSVSLPQERLDSVFGSPYALGADGRLRPKHPWLFSLLLAPGVALAGVAGARLTAIALGAALAALAASRAARDFGPLPAVAGVVAVLLLMPGGRNVLWAINVDTAIALAAFAGLRFSSEDAPLRAGAAAAAALALRPSALLLLAPAPFLLARKGARRPLLALATFLPALGAAGLVNTFLWGAPWRSGYERVVVWGASGPALARHSETFGGSVAEGLGLLLGASGGGLLAAAPIVFACLAAFALAPARTPFWLSAFAASLVAYLALAPYAFLRDAHGTIYRFALPLLAASVGPVAALLAAATRSRRGLSEPPGPAAGGSP